MATRKEGEGQIIVAAAPTFCRGGIEVNPAARQIKGSGESLGRTVEPRVIQVLTALHRAEGNVVPRDSLANDCWGGLDVSEDAINRAIAKLRAALNDASARLKVETIRGAGYRLVDIAGRTEPSLSPHAIIPALDLETRALSAMFEGTADSLASAIAYLGSLVTSQPGVAAHRGSLAMALLLMIQHTAPAERARLAARAREVASAAQRLEPGEGRSLAALAGLEPTFGNWGPKDRQLVEALAASPPGVAPLLFQRVLFLAHSGQTEAALAIALPLAEAAPLVPWIQAATAHLLATTGDWRRAEPLLEIAKARWPKDRVIWLTCFHLWLHKGLMTKALELFEEIDNIPAALSAGERALLSSVASAAATGDGAARNEALALCRVSVAAGRSQLENAILCAAHLRAPTDAIDLLRALFLTEAGTGTGSIALAKIGLEHVDERNAAILFLAPMRSLLEAPEVSALATDIGLVDFWTSRKIRSPLANHPS